jgi:hypothetical protein
VGERGGHRHAAWAWVGDQDPGRMFHQKGTAGRMLRSWWELGALGLEGREPQARLVSEGAVRC